ncbi:MAG: hypothetical protein ACKVJF_09795, partial [Flavobacteriales bacterium]
MGKEKIGKCQLCGKVRVLTREHLPQRGLYPKAVRPQIPDFNIVSACFECNNGAKGDDELLKVVIGDIVDVSWAEHSKERVRETLERNKRLARLMEENMSTEWEKGSDGQRHPIKTFTLPQELNSNVIGSIERMVKAFYFQKFGEVLAERFVLDWFNPDIPQFHNGLRKEIAEQFTLAVEHQVNGG